MKTELAYLAGLVDGEGAIQLNKGRCARNKYLVRRGFTWNLTVKISNTNADLMNWLNTHFGEYGHSYISKQRDSRSKRQHTWLIRDKRNLLPKLLPYLVIKKRHAELLLQALSYLASNGTRQGEEMGKYHQKVARNDIALEKIHEKLRILNARGISDVDVANAVR